jgi:hypothetical protein
MCLLNVGYIVASEFGNCPLGGTEFHPNFMIDLQFRILA